MKNLSSDSKPKMNPLHLQKLVDGELDHQSRSMLLASLSNDSSHWRDIAIAFIEKQIMDEALNSQPAEATRMTNEQSTTQASASSDKAASSPIDQRRNRIQSLLWAAGLAACLLVGIFIGSEFQPESETPVSHSSPELIGNKDATKPIAESPSFSLAEALSRSSMPVPREFRRALLKAGYTLEEDQKLTAVDLPTGGKIELPVRNVEVTYVGLNSIQ
jgi:hypothetical protein